MTVEGRQKAYETCLREEIDALVVIGGNASLTGARDFAQEHDFPVVGLPGTIDNNDIVYVPFSECIRTTAVSPLLH